MRISNGFLNHSSLFCDDYKGIWKLPEIQNLNQMAPYWSKMAPKMY